MTPARLPCYRYDPARIFPECAGVVRVGRNTQSTLDNPRGLSSLVISLAYAMSGGKFDAMNVSMEVLAKEMAAACLDWGIPEDRLVRFARSILIPAEATLTDEQLAAVPRELETMNVDGTITVKTFHDYQVRVAALGAVRMGYVYDLGCGVGKTFASIAACIAARRLGFMSDSRCYIIAPVNAFSTWRRHLPALRPHFQDVQLISSCSLHTIENISYAPGGAIIIDEAHEMKNSGAGTSVTKRTALMHKLRPAFEWGTALTGTLMHTGAGGLMSVMDVACPGLSRFNEDFAFGDAFNCIIKTKLGKQVRRKLGLVPDAETPYLVQYLKRGACSLSFLSPEVSAILSMPEFKAETLTEWPKPTWMDDTYPWYTDIPWQEMAGAEAVALMEEHRDEVRAVLAAAGQDVPVKIDDCYPILETMSVNPFTEVALIKTVRRLIKQRGLPSFSRIIHATVRAGRYNRYVRRIDTLVGHRKDTTYRYVDGPPGLYGLKVEHLRQWLLANPAEAAVVGAAGTGSVAAVATMLDAEGITYRIIQGGVSAKDRQIFETGFDKGEFRVLLAQHRAGSVSISLVRAAYSHLIDHDWSAATYDQFIARVYRQGQTRDSKHFDYALGPMQLRVIAQLERGRSFDETVRKALEAEMRYTR